MRLAEIAFIERGRRHTAAEFSELAGQSRDGHIAALLNLPYMPLPTSAQNFKDMLRQIHKTIFGLTGLLFSGRFRQEGEDGVCYGNRKHQREAMDASKIEDALGKLYDEYLAGINYAVITKVQICRRLAIFLESFFRIHPFHDGNGRVARLVVRRFVNETKIYEIDIYGIKDQKYIKALQKAHRLYDDKQDYSGRVKDPYGDLANWLMSQIKDRPSVISESEPPSDFVLD